MLAEKLRAATASVPVTNSIAVATTDATDPIVAWRWASGSGFKSLYSLAISGSGGSGGVGFSNAADAILLTTFATASNYVYAYAWSVNTGLGSKFSDPSVLPAGGASLSTANGVSFTSDDAAVLFTHGISPYISAYAWSGSGFGTKYSDPGSVSSNVWGLAIAPDNSAVAVVGTISSPYVYAYPWSNSTGFGTKYSNPATTPGGTCRDVVFSPDGATIFVAGGTSYINAYPWSSSTGFGSKYSDPATLPTGAGNGIAVSPDGTAVAVAHTTSPYVTAYPWNNSTGFGTKFADPATLPSGSGLSRRVKFIPDGSAIVTTFSATSSVGIHAWQWSGSGFGSKYADPATGAATGNQFYGLAISN